MLLVVYGPRDHGTPAADSPIWGEAGDWGAVNLCINRRVVHMAEQKVKLKFDGQAHQVDIETYTRTLLGYSTVVQAAAAEIGIDKPIEINVVANNVGSLDVLVQVASTAGEGLLAFIQDNSQALISAVITLTTGLFTLKKDLAGKGKTESVDILGDNNVSLKTENGDVNVSVNVYNFYKNKPEATEAIDDAFTALDGNPAVSGLEISHDDKVAFRAEREEFSAIATSQNYEGNDVVHHKTNATLTVVKPCLAATKTRKWEFIFQGNKISAPIQDEQFLGHLDQYSFGVGTTMEVVLDITKVYDEKYKAYMNKKYVVAEVIGVTPPLTNDTLF